MNHVEDGIVSCFDIDDRKHVNHYVAAAVVVLAVADVENGREIDFQLSFTLKT
jgi:hypothetical protein